MFSRYNDFKPTLGNMERCRSLAYGQWITNFRCGICNCESILHESEWHSRHTFRRPSFFDGPEMALWNPEGTKLLIIVCQLCLKRYNKDDKMLNAKLLAAIERAFVVEEPDPKSMQVSVTDELIKLHDGDNDISAAIRHIAQLRRTKGIAKYGCELTTNNDRNAWNDACKECYDLYAYLTQGSLEGKVDAKWVSRARELLKSMIDETIERAK